MISGLKKFLCHRKSLKTFLRHKKPELYGHPVSVKLRFSPLYFSCFLILLMSESRLDSFQFPLHLRSQTGSHYAGKIVPFYQ